MNNYKLRKYAIRRLLKEYTLFDNWCFMTATPNEPEFMLQELRDFPIEIAPFELEKIETLNVQTIQVQATTKKLILDYLKNRLQNAHIFCNSLEIIASLIKACELTNDNCRAVWSKGNKKYKRTIQGIKRSEVGDKAKKINFYTSTCFEGSDIYDEEGQYIVVSDGQKAHSLNDISTSFKQIIGRIRDTKYNGFVTHILKETRYSEFKSYDEYKQRTLELINDAKLLIETYKKLSEHSKFKEAELNDKYVTQINDTYEIDYNLVTYDLMKYKLAKQIYGNILSVKEEQEKAGMVGSNIRDWVKPTDLIKRNVGSKIKFKDAFEEYVKLKESTSSIKNGFNFVSKVDQERLELLEDKYPFINKAYNVLGVEEIRRLKYVQTNIKRELNAKSNKSNQNKIFRILTDEGISSNNWISRADCKRKIQNSYNAVNINKTAKATDIKNYFDVDEKSKRIETSDSSKVVKGFQIIRERFLFK